MPVKIQELVIQTKLKPDNSSPDKSMPSRASSQQELLRIEKRLKYTTLQSLENKLRDKQER